jgi:hypothetical protein
MWLYALGLSWDSLFMGLLLAGFGLCASSTGRWAMRYGICDGLALGAASLMVAQSPSLERICEVGWLFAWVLAGLLVLHRRWRPTSGESRWLYALPVLLSLDNLLAGPAMADVAVHPLGCVVSVAVLSALLFALGTVLGRALRSRLPNLRDARSTA